MDADVSPAVNEEDAGFGPAFAGAIGFEIEAWADAYPEMNSDWPDDPELKTMALRALAFHMWELGNQVLAIDYEKGCVRVMHTSPRPAPEEEASAIREFAANEA